MEKALFRLVVFRVRGVWVRHQNRHRRWLRWYVLSPNNHFLNTLMSSLPERLCNINCLLVLFCSRSSTPTAEVALRIGGATSGTARLRCGYQVPFMACQTPEKHLNPKTKNTHTRLKPIAGWFAFASHHRIGKWKLSHYLFISMSYSFWPCSAVAEKPLTNHSLVMCRECSV